VRWVGGLLISAGLTSLSGVGSPLSAQVERGPWPRLLVVSVTTEVAEEGAVPRGYSAWINGGLTRPVPANGELRWGLSLVGELELELRDLGDCVAAENPRTLDRREDTIADTVSFRVTCPRAGGNGGTGNVTAPGTEASEPRVLAPVAVLSHSGPSTVPPGTSVTFFTTGSIGDRRVLSPPGQEIVGDAISVEVDATTTYVLTVAGPGGSATDALVIEVLDPPEPRPTAELTATPSSVWQPGDSVTLTVSVEHVDLATLSEVSLRADGVAETVVRRFEFAEASPEPEVFTYAVDRHAELRLTATGNGETVTDALTLHFHEPPVTTVPPEVEDPLPVESESAPQNTWWWGPGVGGAVITGSTSFAIPFLVVSGGPSKHWYGTLQLGLRPAVGEDSLPSSDPGVATGDRRYKIATFGVVGFPTGSWWGVSLAYAAAWETISGLDYYVRRAHGPSAGVRGRWPADDDGFKGLHVVFGADVLYTNVSRYDETVSEWTFGAAPSIVLTFPFG
jgi:hypothetical protein